MAKATLIWFRGNDRPFKTISLGKKSIYTIAVTAALMTVASLSLTAIGVFQSMKITELSRTNENYESKVKEQSARLTDLETENQELMRINSEANAEFERIHRMEGKIKELLGFGPGEGSEGHGNQGGSLPGDYVPAQEEAKPALKEALEELEGNDQSLGEPKIGDGLRDVLTYLEDKRDKMRHVPTILPVDSDEIWISCEFGWRQNPMTGSGREHHNGLDIAGPWKSPIIAPADGVVIRSRKDNYLGEYVKLKHENEDGVIYTAFGHLAKRSVKEGEKIKRGEVLGYMGNTGRSSGTHLHYAVIKDDRYVNPAQFIWDGLNNPLASRD